MVSCIFTCTDDLDAEFPAVAARSLGPRAVPLLCAREIDVPGALPRVIRLLLHCYADPDDRGAPRVPARRRVAAPRPRGRAVTGLEFNRPPRATSRSTRRRPTYAFDGELVKLASNETPFAPHPQVLEAVEAQLRTLNRYPDPEQDRAAPRASPSAPACRRGASRWATARASCCSPAAEAMLEPGAEIVYAWPSFSMYPHLAAMSGAARDHRAARTTPASTTSRRWRARSRPPRAS